MLWYRVMNVHLQVSRFDNEPLAAETGGPFGGREGPPVSVASGSLSNRLTEMQ